MLPCKLMIDLIGPHPRFAKLVELGRIFLKRLVESSLLLSEILALWKCGAALSTQTSDPDHKKLR